MTAGSNYETPAAANSSGLSRQNTGVREEILTDVRKSVRYYALVRCQFAKKEEGGRRNGIHQRFFFLPSSCCFFHKKTQYIFNTGLL
jgi:hypothetical protein